MIGKIRSIRPETQAEQGLVMPVDGARPVVAYKMAEELQKRILGRVVDSSSQWKLGLHGQDAFGFKLGDCTHKTEKTTPARVAVFAPPAAVPGRNCVRFSVHAELTDADVGRFLDVMHDARPLLEPW